MQTCIWVNTVSKCVFKYTNRLTKDCASLARSWTSGTIVVPTSWSFTLGRFCFGHYFSLTYLMTNKITNVVENVILINNIYIKVKINSTKKAEKNRYLNLTLGQVTWNKLRICAHLRSWNLSRNLFWSREITEYTVLTHICVWVKNQNKY